MRISDDRNVENIRDTDECVYRTVTKSAGKGVTSLWQCCSRQQKSVWLSGEKPTTPKRQRMLEERDTEEDTWPAHDLTQERAADHRADGGRDSGLGRPGTLSAKTWHGTKFSLDQEARA